MVFMTGQTSTPPGLRLPAAKEMWEVLEPFHAAVYFSKSTVDRFALLGLNGYWTRYVTSRVSPLGPIGPESAADFFFHHHPRMLEPLLPSVWNRVRPEVVTAARLEAADTALFRTLGRSILRSDDVAEAADLARRAVRASGDSFGRLVAAQADSGWPSSPHLQLWQATTILREAWGDAHSRALMGSDLGGCEALVLLAGTGIVGRVNLQRRFGWDTSEWNSARHKLETRGLIDRNGRLTVSGMEIRGLVEDAANLRNSKTWRELGGASTCRLHSLMSNLTQRIERNGGIPFRNPLMFAP